MREYEELRIRALKTGPQRYLIFANGPHAAAAVIHLEKLPQHYRQELDRLLGEHFAGPAQNDAGIRNQLKELGRELFERFFPDPIRSCFDACLKLAHTRNQGLRLRFDVAPELMDIPFELLRSSATDPLGATALRASISPVRSMSGNPLSGLRLPTPGEEHTDIPLLIIAPEPQGRAALDVQGELRRIREVLPAGYQPELLQVLAPGSLQRATLANLSARLATLGQQPCAVLIIAHGEIVMRRDACGGEGPEIQIALENENENENSTLVSGQDLAAILTRAEGLRLVVLNICLGARPVAGEPFAGLSQALIADLPAVVAMQAEISDASAVSFSPVLFRELFLNRTIDEAVSTARSEMTRVHQGHVEWCNPVLFLHPEFDDGWLFKALGTTDGNEELPDPVSKGFTVVKEAQARRRLDDFAEAAQFMRRRENWERSVFYAHAVLRTKPESKRSQRLLKEAEMELHVDKLLQQARTMDRSSRQPLRKPKDIAEIKPLEPFLRDPAVKKCLEEEIETAITADELYQRAIGAEEQAEWAFVVEQYGRILGDGNQAGSYPLGYRDVQTRLAYARGRAAEVEEDWPRALESYERLDADSFDVALRRPYVCARQAEVDGRWSLAEEVYGEIAEHQDVPLRLPYARARAAAERQDWLGVMQALVGLPFAERDVETWWQTALGQVDEQVKEQEEAGDWPAAHEIYRRLRKALGRRCGKEIKQRQAYAGARAAEQDRSWPVALKKLKQRALRGYLDVEARKAYAQGRVAEEEGQWQKAISAYQTLDGTPQGTGKGCDVAKRLLYAHGRQAELEEDWPAVVSGFGTLPDSYPDGAGDVGRRRRHARGRREDAAGRWAGVVEALEDLDDSYRDGAVGRLRHYARARACEARRDWHGALRAFEVLDSGYRDVGWRGPFVGARWAEENGDWGQAVVAWRAWSTAVTSSEVPGDEGQDGVAESLTYAEGRLAYAEGRLAEEQGDWGAAVGAYQGLPADHRDAAARLAGARAREAEGRDAWEEVLEALEGWEEHLAEAGPMAAYARARCTFAVEDWDSAIDSFGACLPYRDAEQLALVARGRRHEAEGRWSRALAVYAEIPGELPDLAERRQRLEDLRQAAPWVDGLAAAGRVADPLATDADAADDDGGAYGALAAAGITPASSAREINDASFVLMEKGLLSPAARLAWDRLRSLAGRLRADALLYRVRQPEALQRLQQELEVCGQAETLATLSDHLPADAPLFQLLNGHRELAIRAWEERLEAAPHDVEIVHALAIACARRAMYLEEAGVYEEAEGMWRRTIACWTRWLSEDACWEGFRGERAACYGQPVTTGQLARLRRQLGQHLLDTLTARGEWQEVAGRVEKAALYRALAAAFEVEMEGARALKEVGGLHPAGDEPGARLVGGRLYLDHARLGSRLGRRIAELEAEQAADGGFDEFRTALDLALGTGVSEEGSSDITSDITPDLLFRLRATFSELGPAWILLERHQPEQALRALGERYRTRLTDLPADCEAVCGLDAAAGCPRCRRYLEHDPAYLHLPHRGARLLQDAVALAVRAHLELAQTALTTRRDGLDGAQVAWREAIAIARNAGAQVRVKRAIVRVVIGRAEVLGRERGRYRGDRLSEAIHLIDRARELIGGAGQKQLAAKAAELLTDRGVWYGSGSFEYQDLDYEKAAADLRRALELTPDSLHACDNLSRALIFHAANLLPGEDPRRAFGLFTEAIEVLHEGLVRTAGHHQLRSVLHQALSEIEERLFAELSPEELAQRIQETSGGGRPETARDPRGLQELATRQREAGDAVGALLTLIQAVRRDDHDPDLRRVLIAAVRRRA